MNIPPEYLRRDTERARRWWGSLIAEAERRHNIPSGLLYAIYSRETNLGRHWRTAPPSTVPSTPTDDDLTYFIRNAGDGGHGHGIGQVDDRSHRIPANWATDIAWQIDRSAAILAAALRAEGADVVRAANRYNSGQGETSRTTGKDYGPDVYARWQFVLRQVPADREESKMAQVRGGIVRSHVQAFADACQKATGASSFGTYPGHSPAIDRALDIFVPVNSRTLGDAICDFAIKNLKRFGVDYVIYRQRIYNPEIATYWRLMEDRGDDTQNHVDHVHISFEPTAAATPEPTPAPEPNSKETPMHFRYGIISGDLKGQVWLWDSAARIHSYVGSTAAGRLLDTAKVPYVGDYEAEAHEYLRGVAHNAKFTG